MPKAMLESTFFRPQGMADRKVVYFNFGNKEWVGSKIHTNNFLLKKINTFNGMLSIQLNQLLLALVK